MGRVCKFVTSVLKFKLLRWTWLVITLCYLEELLL